MNWISESPPADSEVGERFGALIGLTLTCSLKSPQNWNAISDLFSGSLFLYLAQSESPAVWSNKNHMSGWPIVRLRFSAATAVSVPRLRITWCAIASRSRLLTFFGFIGQRGYPLVAFVEFFGRGCVADFDQRRAQRIAARMFSEHQLPLGDADRFGGDDFVREGILEDAVLVDAGFVRERVRAYYGLVGRYRYAGNLRQQPAGGIQFVEMEIRGYAEGGLPHAQHDGDFLERGIAGAFADAIDRQFKLARARLDRGQGIRHAHAQVVVAVRAQS